MEMNERIRALRKERDMTLEEVGALVGVGKSTVRKWESGDIANMRRDKIAKLAKALGVTPAFLMGWDEEPPTASANLAAVRYLGAVAAGYDHLANEEYEYLNLPAEWLGGRSPDDFFVMRVTGSSMYPQYCDGDKILCLACRDMGRSGRIGVIVYGDGEATLKKIVYEPGEDWVDLVPVNPEYETKRIAGVDLEQCRVLGRAIMLLREIDSV